MNTLEIDSYFLNLIQRNILKVYDNGIILMTPEFLSASEPESG